MDIEQLKFDEKGLIPAVAIDAASGKLLMLAYMNRESLQRTTEEGLACFFSRSRGKLWVKGETSGHYLRVVRITADCDGDALELLVSPEGPACHTGAESCFFNRLWQGPGEAEAFSLRSLLRLIKDRKESGQEGSYTSYLFEKGLDKILKKVGEETAEVIIAAKGGDRKETVYEIADLVYHLLVLMAQTGIAPEDVLSELAGRRVVEKKTKQEKSAGQPEDCFT